MPRTGIARMRLLPVVIGVLVSFCSANIIWAADDERNFKLGNLLLEQQEYRQALAAYESFLQENPEHRLRCAAQWNMANIYMTRQEDFSKAADLYHAILEEQPDPEWQIFTCDRLGQCYEAQEQWAQAAEVYQPLVRILSAATEAAVTASWIGELKRRLLACYRNMGDHESIIGLYQEVLAENPLAPSAPEDQFQLAQAHLENGNLKEATENFALVVERYPASRFAPRVQGERADLLIEQMQYDWTPIAAFQSAQELSRAGEYKLAASQFEEVISARPGSPLAAAASFQNKLIEYRRSGDAVALRDEIASGREKYPFGFGGVPVDQLNEVLRDICQAHMVLKSNPEDAGTYQRLGIGYYRTQAYQCGIDAYRKAIELAPDVALAHNMLGYCCMGAGKIEEAVSAFHQLVEVAPDDPNSYDSLAEGYYQLGDTTRAIHHYQEALGVDSTFSNPYYMLGTIYRELGQREEAVKNLERYMELDPGGFQAQNAQAQLEQLMAEPAENSAP